MIQQFFVEMGAWSWLILGLLLLALEIAAPGTMFLWFGVAAILVGVVSFFIDLGWQSAFILFAVLSLVTVIVGRMILNKTAQTSTDKPLLNQRARALIGKVYVLDEPIVNGKGRVKVHDSYWQVTGPDCAEGSKVSVTGGSGTTLEVELTS